MTRRYPHCRKCKRTIVARSGQTCNACKKSKKASTRKGPRHSSRRASSGRRFYASAMFALQPCRCNETVTPNGKPSFMVDDFLEIVGISKPTFQQRRTASGLLDAWHRYQANDAIFWMSIQALRENAFQPFAS